MNTTSNDNIIMANDDKFILYTSFLSVPPSSFSAFWRAKNAIPALHNIRQKFVVNNFGYICVGLEKSTKPTSFPILLYLKCLLEKIFFILKCTV